MIQKILNSTKEQAIQDYFKLLSFPSVSSEKNYEKALLECADWLQEYLKKMGLKVQRWQTPGQPTLFATYEKDKSLPTLLIYNHYDVQPIDPLDKWESPPFEPTVKEGQVYARGAQDNKGQLFSVLWALQALLKKEGTLPINIKLCIEGEEEVGSKGLAAILNEKKDELKSDYLAVVDVGIPDRNTPAVTLGVRGIVTMEVEVCGSSTDLHSGTHGGIVFNPIHALVKMLASLRDEEGKITIPGFYDQIREVQNKGLLSLDFNLEKYQQIVGASPTGGERQLTPFERAWLRPTLEINGIYGGYTGQGFKTVIPAKAYAKISCRLVPDQNPKRMASLVAEHLKKIAPPGIQVAVLIHSGGGTAVQANPSSKIVEAFSKSYAEAFGTECKKVFDGGSIPIVSELAKTSGAEVVLVGLGLIGDQIHAPNEHFGLDRLEQGAWIIARAIELLGVYPGQLHENDLS
jgi:acetylornithine deacetylase/succinyl-diaminopimelate desuccinylase-like protein